MLWTRAWGAPLHKYLEGLLGNKDCFTRLGRSSGLKVLISVRRSSEASYASVVLVPVPVPKVDSWRSVIKDGHGFSPTDIQLS
jgi:hypothetical protein